MLASLILAVALATPTPVPPPREPNHFTVEADRGVLTTSGQGWQNTSGATTQASGQYEFQASQRLRFSDALHWERLSSTYSSTYADKTSTWQFDFNEYDDEFDVELGRAYDPVGVGVGYFDYNPVYDSGSQYDLAGFGVGVDRWPNFNVPRSYYYNAWYYPSVRGPSTYGGEYGIMRLDAGFNARLSLVSPWSLRVGLQDESWFARDAEASNTRFLGPYVSLSYWK